VDDALLLKAPVQDFLLRERRQLLPVLAEDIGGVAVFQTLKDKESKICVAENDVAVEPVLTTIAST
jgi:hypothetical protein